MKMDGTLMIKSTGLILKERGLQPNGPVQKYIDQDTIRLMGPYTPSLNGALEKSATSGTVIGSGIIHQNTPYARYQYYGKLMVDPITKKGAFYSPGYGFWSRPGVKKILTNTDLIHNKSKHPLAGPFWFERMKTDRKDEILKGAQEIANRGK